VTAGVARLHKVMRVYRTRGSVRIATAERERERERRRGRDSRSENAGRKTPTINTNAGNPGRALKFGPSREPREVSS